MSLTSPRSGGSVYEFAEFDGLFKEHEERLLRMLQRRIDPRLSVRWGPRRLFRKPISAHVTAGRVTSRLPSAFTPGCAHCSELPDRGMASRASRPSTPMAWQHLGAPRLALG